MENKTQFLAIEINFPPLIIFRVKCYFIKYIIVCFFFKNILFPINKVFYIQEAHLNQNYKTLVF